MSRAKKATLKELIRTTARKAKKGLTSEEITQKITSQRFVTEATVRGRISELVRDGYLYTSGTRQNKSTGRTVTVFVS